jgi:hypothetical protein
MPENMIRVPFCGPSTGAVIVIRLILDAPLHLFDIYFTGKITYTINFCIRSAVNEKMFIKIACFSAGTDRASGCGLSGKYGRPRARFVNADTVAVPGVYQSGRDHDLLIRLEMTDTALQYRNTRDRIVILEYLSLRARECS